MPERQIKKLERLPGPEGLTYCYFQRPAGRKGAWVWLEPHQVPEFEGPFAWFECERIKGGWIVLRQVVGPTG